MSQKKTGKRGIKLDVDAIVAKPQEGSLEMTTGSVERYDISPYKLYAAPRNTHEETVKVKFPLSDLGEQQEPRQSVFELTAQNEVGVTTVTLPVYKEGPNAELMEIRLEILVVDAVSSRYKAFIEQTIRRVFPGANIQLLFANPRNVIVSGYVDRAEIVQPIIDLVRGYLERPGSAGAAQAGGSGGPRTAAGGVSTINVVNAIRVTGSQQVQLKVVIAEIDRTKLREFGFEWQWQDLSANGLISQLTNLLGVQGDVTPPTTQNFTVSRAGQFQFNGFLRAIVTHDMGKILAEPVLVATSGQPAFFNSGGETPYLVPQGNNTISIQYKSFGTNLRFVPTVLGEGKIRLEVRPEVSDLSQANGITIAGNVVPGFVTRVAETTVELENGQTFAVAGLMQSRNSANTTKVPLLGDLPLVGWAFQSKGYTQRETELLILVTPHLVDAADERACRLPGRESRVPNDVEFYWGSKFEPPCFEDPYRYDWRKCGPDAVTPVPNRPYDNWGRSPNKATIIEMKPAAPARAMDMPGGMQPMTEMSKPAIQTTGSMMKMDKAMADDEPNLAPPRPASLEPARQLIPTAPSTATESKKTDGDPWADWWAGKNEKAADKAAGERMITEKPLEATPSRNQPASHVESSQPVSEKTSGTVEVVEEKPTSGEWRAVRKPISERDR